MMNWTGLLLSFIKTGIPVMMGEWGAIDKSNFEARATHAQYYADAARKRGVLAFIRKLCSYIKKRSSCFFEKYYYFKVNLDK
jgi:hypothetical protein